MKFTVAIAALLATTSAVRLQAHAKTELPSGKIDEIFEHMDADGDGDGENRSAWKGWSGCSSMFACCSEANLLSRPCSSSN